MGVIHVVGVLLKARDRFGSQLRAESHYERIRTEALISHPGRAPGRIYGRGAGDIYDLDADVIERAPSRIVLLTRERPPRTAVVETGRLVLGGAEIGEAEVHDLPNGIVVVPLGTTEHSVHPEQHAADEAKIERLKRERR